MDHDGIVEKISIVSTQLEELKEGQDRLLSRVDCIAGKPCLDLSMSDVTHLRVATWLWKGAIGLGGTAVAFVGGRALWEWIRKHVMGG